MGPSVGLPADGTTVYRSLVLTKLLMGKSIAFAHVPDVPDTAPATPDFFLEATVTGAGVFTLGIVCTAAVGPFLVASTPSLSRGTSRFGPGMYRNLTVAEQFTGGSNDLTARFQNVFLLTPSVGTKISVQVTPLTPNGFRGVPVQHYAVVEPAPGLSVTGSSPPSPRRAVQRDVLHHDAEGDGEDEGEHHGDAGGRPHKVPQFDAVAQRSLFFSGPVPSGAGPFSCRPLC